MHEVVELTDRYVAVLGEIDTGIGLRVRAGEIRTRDDRLVLQADLRFGSARIRHPVFLAPLTDEGRVSLIARLRAAAAGL